MVFKKYYPLCYRKSHVELFIEKYKDEQVVLIYDNIDKKGIYDSFNQYIDIATDEQLFLIGW